jgi:O-antigen/teichoic acid export membrane protein
MDRSFLKHASVYGLATLLMQAGSFVLLPIYLHCFSPHDFGVLELVGRLAETVGTCLLFGGFRQALLTFYQQADTELDRRRVTSSTLLLTLAAVLVGGFAAMIVAPAIMSGWSTLLDPYRGAAGGATISPDLLRLAVLTILLEPFSLIPLSLIQARLESIRYVAIVLVQFLFRIILCIVFIRFLNWGVAGALAATVIQGVLFGSLLCLSEVRHGVAWPDLRRIGQMLAFALPMLPGGLCFFILHHGDRFFLLRCSPVQLGCPVTEEVGIYALGYKLAMVVAMFSVQPLYMVWSARLYAEARKPEAPVIFGRTFTRVLAAYLLVGLGLCLFAGDIIAHLGPSSYARAALIVPPVVLACYFQSAASLMDAGLYVKQRTGVKLGITLATTAVMILLYTLLIPTWGGLGAAWATLGGFAFLAGSTLCITQWVFPVRYDWPRVVGCLGWVVVLWGCGELCPAGHWMIPAKLGLFLLAPLGAWWSGLIQADEKAHVRDLLGRMWQSWRREHLTPASEQEVALAEMPRFPRSAREPSSVAPRPGRRRPTGAPPSRSPSSQEVEAGRRAAEEGSHAERRNQGVGRRAAEEGSHAERGNRVA